MQNDHATDWLNGTDWAQWRRDPMTGDASARRYERLHGPNGNTVILMDASPETCGSQAAFVDIAAHLRALGLCAPQVLAWDDARGLMILQDLGQTDFARHLRASPQDETLLYTAAVDVLRALQSAPAPAALTRMTPDVGADMIDLAFEWAARDTSTDLSDQIKDLLRNLLQQVDPNPSVLSLRDFHAENLIWRGGETGLSRIGLLDFQDAFVTHPAYDLASLLRDARRDVDPALTDPMIARLGGDDPAFKTAFHVMAVQRNLRILGIFERLERRDGKSGYRALVPRVVDHLRTDLTAPKLAALGPLVHRAFDLGGTPA